MWHQATGHQADVGRVYSHVSAAMRAELTAALQERWVASLRERAQLAPHSIVPVLDAVLTQQLSPFAKIRSQMAPKIGHASGERRPRNKK
jgi:hypothetical protein